MSTFSMCPGIFVTFPVELSALAEEIVSGKTEYQSSYRSNFVCDLRRSFAS